MAQWLMMTETVLRSESVRRLIRIDDTTLRNGTQGEGVSFSLEDELRIAARLDAVGARSGEGGWPGSHPKDIRFSDNTIIAASWRALVDSVEYKLRRDERQSRRP